MESLLTDSKIAPFIAFTIALLVSLFSIPVVLRVASIRNLTDHPGFRKIHKQDIPTLGGVGIFGGFAMGFLMAVNGYMPGVTYFVLATLILFFAGMKDDLITLDPKKKLAAEICAALLLIYFTDIHITNFHGFLDISGIPVWATYAITIFAIIVVVNSLNLIDGIDGLAASTGIISSVTFGICFLSSGHTGYAIMSAALTGALLGFLRFNLSEGKNKIFMGDTGSILVGFLLAAMIIVFNEFHALNRMNYDLHSAPAVSIAILIVPLFDTLRVFTIRVMRGQHPFVADNRHIHHLMLRAGFSHKKATLFISAAQIMIILLAFRLDHIGILWLSLVLLTICLVLTGTVYMYIYHRYLHYRIPVRKEDYGTILNITKLHKFVTGKAIPVPVRAVNGSGSKILPVDGIPATVIPVNPEKEKIGEDQ